MKVSFIVPVYNVEIYIDQCVRSIIDQTYKDFEIILVDDGSSDKSPGLCDRWSICDHRVKTFHKQNGGLSDARNYGLERASGEYVVFLDADDFWINNDSLAYLVKIVTDNFNPDFVGFNCRYYYSESNQYKDWVALPTGLQVLTDNNRTLELLVQSGTVPMSACFKIIKKDFLVNNSIFFIIGLLSEDIPWFIELLDKSRKCIFVNDYVYAYRQSVGSSSITHNIGCRHVDSLLSIIKDELDKIDLRSFNNVAKESLYSFLAYEFCIALSYLQFLSIEDSKVRYEKLKTYQWLLQYTLNPKVKKVSFFYKILGLRLTTKLLQLYLIKR